MDGAFLIFFRSCKFGVTLTSKSSDIKNVTICVSKVNQNAMSLEQHDDNKWWQFSVFGWTFLFKFHLASKSHAVIQMI